MLLLLTILLISVLFLLILKICMKLKNVRCTSQTCLVGKTVIVTGANTGIGFETALDFAKRGAKVILGCRNETKANEAKERIISATGNQNIIVRIINFDDFDSVREFAKTINKTEERLDILCNNAGAAIITNRTTKNGHNIIMQVNYFSHFLLTNLLIDLLKKSAPSRIVNVASIGARFAKLNIDNIDCYAGLYRAYFNSKLCNILFTQEIAKRLDGTGVTTYSLHPGTIYTGIFRRIKGFPRVALDVVGNAYFKNWEEGAQTIIYVAVAKDIEMYSGRHFSDCRVMDTYKTALDPTLSAKLWKKTIQTVDIKPEEIRI